MMEWTDRHCRHFHRLLTRRTRLYTVMITSGALRHGDAARHLDFDAAEHPVALQLGGSEPDELAHAARLGERWGYDEINLNCGCPSERVQRGAFGACLMKEPRLVADCVAAMRDAVTIPVTVKHRIGVDEREDYGFVRDFVGTVADAGCEVFVVHARSAWLKGLSPKANREIPPLRHELVRQLKHDFPALTIVVNGGIAGDEAIAAHLREVDGVMVGRDAYHHPWHMVDWDRCFLGAAAGPAGSPEAIEATEAKASVEAAMVTYMARQAALGVAWPAIARHMLGLWHGEPGARRWRQVWSDHRLRDEPVERVARLAAAARLQAARREPAAATAADAASAAA